MEHTEWLEISIDAPAEELDLLSARLIANGVPGFALEEEGDFLRFLEENRDYWDYVDDALLAKMKGRSRIQFYVTNDDDGTAQLTRYLAGIDLPYETLPLKEDDWAYSWQKYYRPMPVGQRLYILPEWERDAPVPAGRIPLLLNPGLSFGTGSHASTQLCLEALEGHISPGGRVLDLGCGSGILSIAALLLGAAQADAVDIDPKAAEVSRANAALSGFGPARYEAFAGDLLSDSDLLARFPARTYQLVLANIVADVIISLAPLALRAMAQGGYFICSGIIAERAQEVRRALSTHGFSVSKSKEKDGWLCLICQAP